MRTACNVLYSGRALQVAVCILHMPVPTFYANGRSTPAVPPGTTSSQPRHILHSASSTLEAPLSPDIIDIVLFSELTAGLLAVAERAEPLVQRDRGLAVVALTVAVMQVVNICNRPGEKGGGPKRDS